MKVFINSGQCLRFLLDCLLSGLLTHPIMMVTHPTNREYKGVIMVIRYFVKGDWFAQRERDIIPRVGELVRFNGEIFIIKCVVWIEDIEPCHVAIDVEPECK